MSIYADVRELATTLGIHLPPTEIGDTETGAVVRSATARMTELLRRDWATQVLDAYADLFGVASYTIENGTLGRRVVAWRYDGCKESRFTTGECSDLPAARLAAAEALWDELPEEVRNKIGEAPC